jgi:hypothetical protein
LCRAITNGVELTSSSQDLKNCPAAVSDDRTLTAPMATVKSFIFVLVRSLGVGDFPAGYKRNKYVLAHGKRLPKNGVGDEERSTYIFHRSSRSVFHMSFPNPPISALFRERRTAPWPPTMCCNIRVLIKYNLE